MTKPKVEEIEIFECHQMNCHYNESGTCDATVEWADVIHDYITQHQEDYPEEEELTFDEAQEEVIPEEPTDTNCELFHEDEDKCPACGGQLEMQTSYFKDEAWGAVANIREDTLVCSDCGEEN